VGVKPSSRCIAGRATFTMAASRITMNCTAHARAMIIPACPECGRSVAVLMLVTVVACFLGIG